MGQAPVQALEVTQGTKQTKPLPPRRPAPTARREADTRARLGVGPRADPGARVWEVKRQDEIWQPHKQRPTPFSLTPNCFLRFGLLLKIGRFHKSLDFWHFLNTADLAVAGLKSQMVPGDTAPPKHSHCPDPARPPQPCGHLPTHVQGPFSM